MTVVLCGVASAATRTVCLELRFKDNRNPAQCALTTATGNQRGCSPGNDMNHRGAILELWDKDSDGSDEMIGRFFLHARSVAFSHPFTRAPLHIKSPLPEDLSGVLRARGLGEPGP